MAQGLVAKRAWTLTASSLTSLLLLSVRVISGAMRKHCGGIAVGPHAGYRLAPRSPAFAARVRRLLLLLLLSVRVISEAMREH